MLRHKWRGSQGNRPGDIGIKETRNKAPVKGNSLSLQLVKQAPDAIYVSMETVSGHQLVVRESRWFKISSFQSLKLLQGLCGGETMSRVRGNLQALHCSVLKVVRARAVVRTLRKGPEA